MTFLTSKGLHSGGILGTTAGECVNKADFRASPPEDLTSIPGIHIVEEKPLLPVCSLTSTHALWYMSAHMHAYTHIDTHIHTLF